VEAKGNRPQSDLRFRVRYALRPIVLIDLLAVLPFYLGMFFNIDLRFLRALRIARVFKLTRYSPAFALLTRAIHQERHALSAAMFFLFITLIIASSGIYMFEHRAQPQAFGSIPAAVWWAIATLTTVGYGDVTPITIGGKAFGIGVMVIGVGMVALPTAILASAFSEQLRRRREEYQEMVDVALHDGIVTTAERSELERIRGRLGLSEADAERILRRELRNLLADKRDCPHCGHPAEPAALT
jgi:voltage-gated potassium channel